jgi:HNH endonuclease
MNKCLVEGCESRVKWRGLCGKHYKRQWRHGDPTKTLIDMDRKPFNCKVEDCGTQGRYPATMMCHAHHIMFIRYGRTERIVAEHGNGRPRTAAGYVLLTREGRRVYEHIWLAELALGKSLPEKAVVHHMNDIPDDNFTFFNLIICPDQKYHMLLHRRAKEYEQFGKCLSTE